MPGCRTTVAGTRCRPAAEERPSRPRPGTSTTETEDVPTRGGSTRGCHDARIAERSGRVSRGSPTAAGSGHRPEWKDQVIMTTSRASDPAASTTHGGRPRVVIVGTGFGGLFAAQRLRKADVDVTIIGKTSHHLFQPLLYQEATGILSEGEIAPATREILRRHDNTRVVLGEV